MKQIKENAILLHDSYGDVPVTTLITKEKITSLDYWNHNIDEVTEILNKYKFTWDFPPNFTIINRDIRKIDISNIQITPQNQDDGLMFFYGNYMDQYYLINSKTRDLESLIKVFPPEKTNKLENARTIERFANFYSNNFKTKRYMNQQKYERYITGKITFKELTNKFMDSILTTDFNEKTLEENRKIIKEYILNNN